MRCILQDSDFVIDGITRGGNWSTNIEKIYLYVLFEAYYLSVVNTISKVGATNRPGDLDTAIMRRLKLKVPVGLPSEKQRKSILETTMQNETSIFGKYNLDVVAQVTKGYSGNDLHELCRYVNVFSLRILWHNARKDAKIGLVAFNNETRII